MSSSCSSEENISLTRLTKKEGKYYKIESNELYSGKVFLGKEMCGFIENGLIKGKWIQYDLSNDVKLLESFYVNGEKEGEEVQYCSNGSIARKSFYKNGLKQGKEIVHSCTKHKIVSVVEYKEGVLNGKMTNYYNYPEQIKEVVLYKEGNIDGYIKRYNEEGKLAELIEHKDGKPHGQWIIYDDNQNIISKETYENGNLVSDVN